MPPLVIHHKQEVSIGFIYVWRLASVLHSNELHSFVETVELFPVCAAVVVAMAFSVSVEM
jgi:hypothetical protein